MEARVVQINRSGGGVPKLPLEAARISVSGVEGDRQADKRYHGGPLQALCLFANEQVRRLASEGFPVVPGSLGENLTTEGLPYWSVRIGDVYRAGEQVRFQITKPRVPCTTIQVYGEKIIKRLWGQDVPWGESGFYARVVSPGAVRQGDPLHLEQAGPEPPPAHTQKRRLAEADFAPPR
ncbi:MAG TPA: MOSC domain-containing protein [Candidatus Thermoplasmatota archaeon]|nr:MOSC domain-containing protein [Candidatus Thermoplasmatota archaeon]